LKLRIEEIVIKKSLYLLPVPQFDAIVELSFFRENEISLAGLETRIIEINESKIPMIEDDIDLEESPGNMKTLTIEMISGKRLKKKLKCDEIEKLY